MTFSARVLPIDDKAIDAIEAAIADYQPGGGRTQPALGDVDARAGLLLAHHAVREAIGRVLHAQPRELSAAAEALAAAQLQLDVAVERASAALGAASAR